MNVRYHIGKCLWHISNALTHYLLIATKAYQQTKRTVPLVCGVVAASGFSRASYPKSELPEAESVCSTESVGQPVNSTRRYAVSVDPRATDTAYRLNHHIIWKQAVVIRLCVAIRPAHCLTLLSPRRLILISWPLHYFNDIDFWNMNKSLSFSFMRILSE